MDEHRHGQRDAIAAAAWELAQLHGPFSVTMSQVAAAAGVSRPTVYKYFSDVESMLSAHHQKHVEAHVAQLANILEGPGTPRERLTKLARAYAAICHERSRHEGAEVDRVVHSPLEMDTAEAKLVKLFATAIERAEIKSGGLAPNALATYCVRALASAADVPHSRVDVLADMVVGAFAQAG